MIESTDRLCTVYLDKAMRLNVFDAIIASGDPKSERPFVVSFYPNAEIHQKNKDFQWEDVSAAIQIFTVLSQLLSKILECQKQQFVMTE